MTSVPLGPRWPARRDFVVHFSSMPEQTPRFLAACRCEPVDTTPVWLMRQAGRYMKEYREVRKDHSILEICKTPDLAAEVTITAAEILGVDAAIIFADLLLPVEPMGMSLEFATGEGPQLREPIRSAKLVEDLRVEGAAAELGYVGEAIRKVDEHFGGKLPVIGFAGAPFTLASYMIEGGSSRNYLHTKGMMYGEPKVWDALLTKICDVLEPYLFSQIAAGASVIQLFDSWVGTLGEEDYRRFALPYTTRLIKAIQSKGVPAISFSTGTTGYLPAVQEAGADVLSVDWRLPLDKAWAAVDHKPALQGNLDPALLFAPWSELKLRVETVLDQAGGRPGHIFNLGHGIIVDTPVDNVIALIKHVHEYAARQAEAGKKNG